MATQLIKPKQVATFIARSVFARRGNHTEAHIQESELISIVEHAIIAYDKLRDTIEQTQTDLFAIKQPGTKPAGEGNVDTNAPTG